MKLKWECGNEKSILDPEYEYKGLIFSDLADLYWMEKIEALVGGEMNGFSMQLCVMLVAYLVHASIYKNGKFYADGKCVHFHFTNVIKLQILHSNANDSRNFFHRMVDLKVHNDYCSTRSEFTVISYHNWAKKSMKLIVFRYFTSKWILCSVRVRKQFSRE